MKRFLTLLAAVLITACSSTHGDLTPVQGREALSTVLVGDTTSYTATDNTPAGMAEAWRYTAGSGGTANSLSLCIAAGNTSQTVKLGLYASNSGGTAPSTLLTSGGLAAPVTGWNTVSVPPVSIASGTKYWLAVLSPVGAGTVTYCAALGTVQYGARATNTSSLTALPATYPAGVTYRHWSTGIYASAVTVDAGAGGATGAGGAASGGAASGGAASGGFVGSGGAVASGGTVGDGGAVGTGGAVGSGGAGSGGDLGTGGAVSSGGATGTGGSAAGLGAHTHAYYTDGSTTFTTISTPAMATQSSGSTMLVGVGRGILSAHALPTDNKSNSPYIQIGTKHGYTNWPTSGTALYAFPGFAGGSGHVVTETTPPGDEITLFASEVMGRTVVQDWKWNEQLAGSAITSLGVTTTGPATLVAYWWGDGFGPHTAVPNNGFTVVDAVLTGELIVQGAVAIKEVATAGTYNVTWTTTPVQGAQLWIAAIQ